MSLSWIGRLSALVEVGVPFLPRPGSNDQPVRDGLPEGPSYESAISVEKGPELVLGAGCLRDGGDELGDQLADPVGIQVARCADDARARIENDDGLREIAADALDRLQRAGAVGIAPLDQDGVDEAGERRGAEG